MAKSHLVVEKSSIRWRTGCALLVVVISIASFASMLNDMKKLHATDLATLRLQHETALSLLHEDTQERLEALRLQQESSFQKLMMDSALSEVKKVATSSSSPQPRPRPPPPAPFRAVPLSSPHQGVQTVGSAIATSPSPHLRKRKRGAAQPERKCKINAVLSLLRTHNSPALLLSPSDPRTKELNDFPCAATEMHTCACQIKCRDDSCSSAVHMCLSLPGQCAAIGKQQKKLTTHPSLRTLFVFMAR